MANEWKDIFMDEDAPEQPKVDLPTDNEKEGEDNGQGSEAAGALSESGDAEGIKDVPMGEDEITGTDSTEYADVFDFLKDEDDEKPAEGEGDKPADEPAKEGEEKGEEAPAEGDEEEKEDKKKKAAKKRRRNSFSIFDEDAPAEPTVDLPTDNEKEGEDNGQGSEAAGALSESGDAEGISDVPAGEDEITGTKSTEYADIFDFLKDEGEDEGKAEEKPAEKPEEGEKPAEEGEDEEKPAEGEEEAKDCGGSKKRKKAKRNAWDIFFDEGDEQPEDNDEANGDEDKPADETKEGEEKPAEEGGEAADKKRRAKKRRRNEGDEEGSDDDGASEKEPVGKPDGEEGEEEKKDEPTEDAWNFFLMNEGIEEPENLPGDPKPVEPVDGQGKEICPIGNPDLPEKELTEPVLLPVETENGDPDAMKNHRISDRYFFN